MVSRQIGPVAGHAHVAPCGLTRLPRHASLQVTNWGQTGHQWQVTTTTWRQLEHSFS